MGGSTTAGRSHHYRDGGSVSGGSEKLSPQEWAFRALPYDARAEYRKTYLYAWRRLGKAGRNLKRAVAREYPFRWFL